MKKNFLSVAMSALFLIGSLSMISMAPPPPAALQCARLADELAPLLEEYGVTDEFVNACAVCANQADKAAQQANCICKILTDKAAEVDFNQGECIKVVKNAIRGKD